MDASADSDVFEEGQILVARLRGGETDVEGRIVDFEDSLVAVEFPGRRAPMLPIAKEVELTLIGGASDIDVRARVVFQGEGIERIRYQFQLSSPERPDLARLFRRRGAFRARPDANAPVEVLMRKESGGPQSTAILHDISSDGLSLLVSTEDEDSLFDSRRVCLSFRLPGDEALFEIVGVVRQRMLCGSTIRYGIQYDEDATADFRAQEERLTSYVMNRQVEQIRRERESA